MKIAKCVQNPKNNANANKNNETFVNRLWVRNDFAILNVARDKPFSLLVIFVFCFPRYCIWCLSFSSFYCKLFYYVLLPLCYFVCVDESDSATFVQFKAAISFESPYIEASKVLINYLKTAYDRYPQSSNAILSSARRQWVH